ncbi:DUF805 domain-containing protein [Sphingopyxis sp. BSNA05]|uniref:DUF805 domain-containing protein n=1 Tax=Sphingopyxis sp. BSNA05 TaxID=1236614 RepID=UPI00349F2BE1
MLLPLRRYADFSGRSRRREFWMFFLFQFLIHIAFLPSFFCLDKRCSRQQPESPSILNLDKFLQLMS